MLLSELNIGQHAVIAAFDDYLGFSSKLEKLGVEKDSLVEVLHLGFPFKDPIAIKVDNHTVALSRSDAEKISISPL